MIEMIVCNAGGLTADDGSTKIEGTICPKLGSLYEFYAIIAGSLTTKREVKIILPVGGNVSGLYRFPRVGEKVLVETKGTAEGYLIGYVPDSSNPIVPTLTDTDKQTAEDNKLQADKGLVLRYQQTGKTDPGEDEKYSEIGFYHQQTSWKVSNKDDYNNPVEVNYDTNKKIDIPKIDRINIKSTGDIYSDAQNYQEIKAKRFELLVNEDADDHMEATKEAEKNNDKAKEMLLAGDMRVKAKNRITIEAGEEIEIKVGRSFIKISESGIELTTRKGHLTASPWDTTLELDARSGISMFGQEVEVGSVNGFSLGDTLGSSISGGLGTIGISGKAVKIETFHRGMGVAHLIAATLEMIWSVAAVGRSIDGDTDDVEKAMPALQAISGIARDLTGNCTRPPDDAGQDLVLFVLNLIVNIIRAVIDNCDYPTVIKEPKQRDRLNLAGLVVEWGYLLAAQGILILKNAGTDWTHEATIELKADASLSFEGTLGKSLFTLETYNAITVAAAAPTDAQKKQAVSDSSISVKNQEPKLGWGLLNGIPNAISEISDLINGYVNDYHSAFNAEAELKEL